MGRDAVQRAGPAHPQHAGCRRRRFVQGDLHPGRGYPAVRPGYQTCRRRPCGNGMRRRPGPVPQRNGQLRPRLPAGLDLPGKGRHFHQCRAPHQSRPPRHDAEERLCRLGSDAKACPGDGARLELQPSVRNHGRDRRDDAELCAGLLRLSGKDGFGAVALQ